MKKMTTIFLASLFFSTITWAGGTTAGGGNVQLPDQVKAEDLVQAVMLSRSVILSWLTSREIIYRGHLSDNQCGEPENQAMCPIYAKLFDGKKTIFDVVHGAQVQTKFDGPCLDFNKKPNDGSMFGEKEGSVCISISSIKEKLRDDNYQNQIAALLTHEFSHMLGTTEEEAVLLQTTMLKYDLSEVSFRNARRNIFEGNMEMGIFAKDIYAMADSLRKVTDFPTTCQSMTDLAQEFFNLYLHKFSDSNMTYFWDARDRDVYGAESIKVRVLSMYVCSQDPRESAETRQAFAKDYNDLFKDKTEITGADYQGPFSESAPPDIKIHKITDKASLVNEGYQISDEFMPVAEHYMTFASFGFDTYPKLPQQ
jgi:hypothetical protein